MLLLLVMMTGNCRRTCKREGKARKARVSADPAATAGLSPAYLVSVPVGCDQELRGRFSDRIRIGRPQRTALIKDLRRENQPVTEIDRPVDETPAPPAPPAR